MTPAPSQGVSEIKKAYKALGLEFGDEDVKRFEAMGPMELAMQTSAVTALLTMAKEREALEEARESHKRMQALQETYFSQLLAGDTDKPSGPLQ